MYLFEDDASIGLQHTNGWIKNFYIEKSNFDLLLKIYGERPQWSLVEGASFAEIQTNAENWNAGMPEYISAIIRKLQEHRRIRFNAAGEMELW